MTKLSLKRFPTSRSEGRIVLVAQRFLCATTEQAQPIMGPTKFGVHYLAHMNYARLKAPMEDSSMAEFRAAMDPINTLAKRTPGFVWSLDYPEHADGPPVAELQKDPLLMPQLSLWDNPQAIQHFAFKSGHFMYYKRKREWFTSPAVAPWAVCWWFRPTNEMLVPTLFEAFARLKVLRDNNGASTSEAFDLASAKEYPKPPPLV